MDTTTPFSFTLLGAESTSSKVLELGLQDKEPLPRYSYRVFTQLRDAFNSFNSFTYQ